MAGSINLAALDSADPADRALGAAVSFLARIDPATGGYLFVRALHRHRSGSHGMCALHSEPHPCLTRRLAEAARDLCAPPRVPLPRKGTG